jgi:hypothetical protein
MTEGRTPKDVILGLTEVDGGCRDINWFGLNTDGAVALLRWIGEGYAIIALTETEGDEANPCDVDSGCDALVSGRSVRGYFEKGPSEISQIQYYSYRDDDSAEWFVELTFFPQDVSLTKGLALFVGLLEDAKLKCGAFAYFVRYEDASFDPVWEERKHREVVYSSEDVEDILAALALPAEAN